ncbi:MAG: hypothetical protein NG784_00930 [Candidatus Jettenia sp.]|nr:hypothetical protein [Candidatus Jettenia sp.]
MFKILLSKKAAKYYEKLDDRYKLGHIRIIYTVNNNKEIIIIEAIGARGDIYK